MVGGLTVCLVVLAQKAAPAELRFEVASVRVNQTAGCHSVQPTLFGGSGFGAVSPEIASRVPRGEPLQIVLQRGGSKDDPAWRAVGRRQFEIAYSADDSVYEQLIDDASVR